MSVGKLVPKGKTTIKGLVRGKEDAPIFLHITSSEQVVNLFEDKPPGYCILRLDPVFIEKWSRSPLLLTYKFGALLFTQILRVPHLRVKASKKEILLCQCDKNSYSHIRSTAEFLPKLQSFIAEFVSNKNFVEKPLDSYSPDLKNELYYKKYLIFPANGTRLVLKKKKEDEVETAEAGIVFSNLSFFGKKGEDIKSINTFNEFLLEFLGMEEATEPQMKALGVSIQSSSRPANLSDSSGANPSRLHIPSPRLLPMHGKAGKKGQFDVLAFTGKEKSAVIERLKKAGEQTIDIADSGSSSTRSQRKYTDPREGLNTFLKELFDAVKVGQLANEKMDWIRRGLFDALVASGLIAEFTSDLQLDGPTTTLSPPQKRDMLVGKILRHLLSNNAEGCREFVKLMGEMLKKAREEDSEFPWGECVGLFTLLSVLIRSTDIEPFPTIFVQELGVNRMLEVYNDAANRIEADSAAEAEFQKALFKRMEEGAHRTAGGPGASSGLFDSGGGSAALAAPANYHIPVPPPPPPPLVIKRGKIRKMKKRFKTHNKKEYKKDQHSDIKETPPTDDETEKEKEKEKEDAEGEKNKGKGVKLNTSVEFSTPRTSVDSSSPRPVIPALSLSSAATKTKDDGLASAQSRFSRRRGINDETPRTPTSGRGSFGKELGRNTSFYITPSIQLTKLAFNLGETAVAADLTALMRYKTGVGNPDEPTDLSAEARNKRRSKRLSTSLSNLHNSLAIFKPGQLKPEASSFRSTAPYKIKTMILKALAKIIALPHLYAYVRSPVNLIFTELNKALANGLLKIDQPFRALLFSVLQPVSDRVEYCHRIAWQHETRPMSVQRKMDFRRGLDKFLCRVHSQLCDALSRQNLADLELCLVMLGDYLHFCPTRVMASQVIDVAMETLLHVKFLVFNMVPESLSEDMRIQHIRLTHSLVRVFQELCAQTKHEGTLVFLLQLLLGTNETVLFFRGYAKRILFSDQTIQEITSHESKETLTEYRLQIIKLFSSLVSLVGAKLKYIEERKFPTSPLHLSGSAALSLPQLTRINSAEEDVAQSNKEEDNDTAWCVCLLEQLGFLISPQTGYFMRFLGQGNHFTNFEVKKVMLQLFGQILMTPCNPFACNKAYTEFFISHHYLTFLKLYNSDGFDSSTLSLCALHLQILLCFAEHKTEKIKRKFYQLRIMDFLARQISLEYEIILKNAQYIESHARSPEPQPATSQSSPNLGGQVDLRAQGILQMQQSSSLPTIPLPRKITGELPPSSSLATTSTSVDPKRVASTPALSPRKEPIKKAAKRKARAQSMSFTDSPLKLSLSSVTGNPEEGNAKRSELVSSSRAVLSQNRDDPIIVSDRAQKEEKKRNRTSGSYIRTSNRRIPAQSSGEKGDWGMRSMPSWSRTKDSAVTSATSSASASASASPAWTPEAPEPEKKTFGQLKSSINMGSIGKKVGKAITLPGLKLGTSLTRESSAALVKELAAAEYQCSGAESSSDDEDMMKPRVSIGSIVTMIPPLRLSDTSSISGPHSGQQLIVEMTSSSTFQTTELTSDGSRTETELTEDDESDDDATQSRGSVSSMSSMSSSSGKLLIPGLKLSGAETKDGSAAIGKGNVVIMKSPTAVSEPKKMIAIPGLKLTGADTKDGSTAVGKGTTLLKSPTTTSTFVSGRGHRERADSDDETGEGTDADGDDEGTDKSESDREMESESESESERESDDGGSPVKPLAKLAIPGLKLTGADTKDGTAAVGKGTVLVKAASSDSSESESEDEAPPPVVAKIAIPGLKLTGADTKDGSTAVGRGTVLLKTTANTSQNSSLEDLRSPLAARSSSESESESESEDEPPRPPPPAVTKLAIPGLKLTGADTKDGSSAVGKGTVLTLKTASKEDIQAVDSTSSESESDEDEEIKPAPVTAKIAIPGLKLTGADTKDGSSAVGKGTTLVVSTTAVATTAAAAAARPMSPRSKEAHHSSSESESDDNDEGRLATGTDHSDSERSDRDESPHPSPSVRRPFAIPGLKLTANETKDGTASVGKGTNLGGGGSSDDDPHSQEDLAKSASPRPSVSGSPSRASPRLSPGSPSARPAIPSLKFPATNAESTPMPSSPTRGGANSSKEGKEGRKLIEIQERRRITPRTPKKPIMTTHPPTPKRPMGGSDGAALPSPKLKVTFGGPDGSGSNDLSASSSPRATATVTTSSPLSPNRSAPLTIPSGTGGLEKSNSASLIPKLRFTEDLRQHNFKQEEFLKEALGEKPQKFPQLVVPAGGKTLSDIEHRILQSDPSLRFVKQSTNRRILEDIENLTGMLDDIEELSPEDIIERNQLYLSERNERKIYMDKALHITFLQLIFSLLLTPMGTLQPLYTDQFPVNNKKLNIPFLLHSHINHPANGPIIPELVERSLEMKEGAYRMLKLLTNRLFSPEQYQHMKRIAIGAYGTVYKCTVGSENLNVAVKLMELPKSIWDRCVLHDIFTEILVLDAYKDDKRICKLYDYGVSEEHYWVIMRFYRCSLKEWRLRQTRPLSENLVLYLNIFSRVLETMKICIKGDKFKINHFDLKCDNVLIDPIDPNIEEEELLNPRSDKPPFNVCLADFGESTVYQSEDDGYTTRSRGTEFNKSPEMLNAAYANKKDDLQKYDRRKKTGCNKASDVWALGCLLYELLTGEFLFYDNDWVRFFIRVTYLGQELITAEKRAKIDNNPHLLRFFQWIFMRNPLMRPTLEDVIVKFQEMLNVMMPQLQESALSASMNHSPTNSSNFAAAADPRASMSMSGPMIFNNNNEEFLFSPTSRYHRHTLAHSLKTGDQRPGQATETDHYHEIMNKLTPHIFLGNEANHEINQLKFHYSITHIINCSEVANAHPQQFEYLQIASLKDVKLMEVIQFIRAATEEHGKVLVSYHGRSSEFAVGIILAYLIEQHNLTYFEAFNLVKNRRYIIKPNPQLVAKVRASMSSTVKQPDSAITADGTPELYIWDDKRKKERKKKEKEKEKRTEKAKDPVNPDEVEHTAFNPLVFNRQIQERIRRNKEAGLDPLHVPVRKEHKPTRSRLRRSSSADDIAAVAAKDQASRGLLPERQSPGRKLSKEL